MKKSISRFGYFFVSSIDYPKLKFSLFFCSCHTSIKLIIPSIQNSLFHKLLLSPPISDYRISYTKTVSTAFKVHGDDYRNKSCNKLKSNAGVRDYHLATLTTLYPSQVKLLKPTVISQPFGTYTEKNNYFAPIHTILLAS